MANQHILGSTEIDDTNVTLLDLKNDVANLKNKTNLVKHIEITTKTSTINVTDLDINRDGGIYDIIIYMYTHKERKDLFMRINNNTSSNYHTIRNFSRPTISTDVKQDIWMSQSKWCIGDAYDRWMFKGTLVALNELAVYCPRLEGRTICVEGGFQDITECGCYFNGTNTTNITSLQFSLTSGVFTAGHIFIYKRDN